MKLNENQLNSLRRNIEKDIADATGLEIDNVEQRWDHYRAWFSYENRNDKLIRGYIDFKAHFCENNLEDFTEV